jgi:hypothetical protein
MLKEVDLRIRFTERFVTSGAREHLDRLTLQKRLLLCLYALGTNTGLKRMSGGDANENYKDLLYIRRRFLNSAAMRNAIAQVANAIFQTRLTHIWGEATTACASDSKKFGAWDQNLLTEWHARYRGPGVMTYYPILPSVENRTRGTLLSCARRIRPTRRNCRRGVMRSKRRASDGWPPCWRRTDLAPAPVRARVA